MDGGSMPVSGRGWGY